MVIMFINSLLMKCLSTFEAALWDNGGWRVDGGKGPGIKNVPLGGGNDQPHNNTHPVQIVFCWERIA